MSRLLFTTVCLFQQQSKHLGCIGVFTRHLCTPSAPAKVAERPLLLLHPWVRSLDRSDSKYVDFWLDRNFDVVTVKTDAKTAICPALAGPQRSRRVYAFLKQLSPAYDQIVVHAFSAGTYQFEELLLRLDEGKARGEREAFAINNALQGMIFDSMAFIRQGGVGMALSANVSNPRWLKIWEFLFYYGCMLPGKPFTIDYFARGYRRLATNPDRIPGMMMYSLDDPVSLVKNNLRMLDHWNRAGALTMSKQWEKSEHVKHFLIHHEEYVQKIDEFLECLPGLTKATKSKGRGKLLGIIR